MNFKKICYRGGGSTYFARMKFHKKGRMSPLPTTPKFDTMLLTQSVDDPRSNGGGMELRAINIMSDYRITSLAFGSSSRCLTTMLVKQYKNE